MLKLLYSYNMEKVRRSCQFDFDAITETAQKTADKTIPLILYMIKGNRRDYASCITQKMVHISLCSP